MVAVKVGSSTTHHVLAHSRSRNTPALARETAHVHRLVDATPEGTSPAFPHIVCMTCRRVSVGGFVTVFALLGV